MRFSTIFGYASAFFVVYIQAGSGDWTATQLGNVIHRIKRESNLTDGQADANTRCVIKNLKDIEQKLEKELPAEKNVSKAASLAKPHQLFTNADPATLEKFCTIYKASRFRLAACGDSQMKSFAAKALAVVDFVCIDRYEDFIGAFPCIQKVDRLLDAICQKNCSDYESAAEKLNNAGASIVKKYGPNEIKELFAQSCLYVSCFMDCQKPMLESKCGGKVLDLEMSSIGVTFRNLDDMMSQSSASNVWPRECKPLSSMGLHEGKIVSASSAVAFGNETSRGNDTSAKAPILGSTSQASTAQPNSTVLTTTTTTQGKITSLPNTTSLLGSNSTILPTAIKVGNATARAKLRSVRKN